MLPNKHTEIYYLLPILIPLNLLFWFGILSILGIIVVGIVLWFVYGFISGILYHIKNLF